jgi:hypothetical protein
MTGRVHKTIEAVLKNIASGLYAGEMENLISGTYKVTINGKEMILECGGQKFKVTVEKVKR